jgi:hypothetical protein
MLEVLLYRAARKARSGQAREMFLPIVVESMELGLPFDEFFGGSLHGDEVR